MGSSPKQEAKQKKLVKKWVVQLTYECGSRIGCTLKLNAPTESEILAELYRRHPTRIKDIKIIKIDNQFQTTEYE